MSKYAFYLKVDKGSKLALDNLDRWLKAVSLMEGDCYILCDRDEVIQKVRDRLVSPGAVTFIKSARESEELAFIIRKAIPEDGMVNAGYAHLTTFLHAGEKDYDFFWNIDADDTQFCLSATRIAELLKCAGDYAAEKGLDCFSLDMHASRIGGWHWSFGVTYTKNRSDWLAFMCSHAEDRAYLERDIGLRFNLDWYFTYLRSLGERKIETFYVENLKFIHYHLENMFTDLCIWGILHWKENELHFPMLETFSSGESSLGRYPVLKDTVKLDMGIEDWEAKYVMLFQRKWGVFVDSIDYGLPEEGLSGRRQMYYEKFDLIGPVACWGYGNCLKWFFSKITEICPVACICDSDERKWGEEHEGCRVVSPEELVRRKVSFVVITVMEPHVTDEIKKQLEAYGITSYCHITEWLKLSA